MKHEDELRFFKAKTLGKKTILFSKKEDWEEPIKSNLNSYLPFFYDFNEVNPDRFDYVVPLTLYAQKYINEHFKYLSGRKALVPSNEAIGICDDKQRFAEFLINNGFDNFVPRTGKHLVYPYIVKKKIGEWGVGAKIISDTENEREHVNKINSEDYFCQEYIEGKDEYTTHIIIYDKKIMFFKTLKFLYSERFFVKGKEYKGLSRNVADHSCFASFFECILNMIDYQGICCFNYKLHNNEIKIFEINPRFGGSMTMFVNKALIVYGNILNNACKGF